MKITLKGVLKVLGALLPFLPGGTKSPHAGVTLTRVFVASPLTNAPDPGLHLVTGIAVNIDAAFLANIEGAEEIAKVVDPSNAVLLIVSGESATTMRAVLGLSPAPVG